MLDLGDCPTTESTSYWTVFTYETVRQDLIAVEAAWETLLQHGLVRVLQSTAFEGGTRIVILTAVGNRWETTVRIVSADGVQRAPPRTAAQAGGGEDGPAARTAVPDRGRIG